MPQSKEKLERKKNQATKEKELKDVPEDAIESVVENLMFGGQLEETDDGKLLMVSFF